MEGFLWKEHTIMSYSFVIADELIEDLKTGHEGIRVHVRNRLYGLRNMHLRRYRNIREDEGERRGEMIYYLELDRIISRLHEGDSVGAITMLREFQEFLDIPYLSWYAAEYSNGGVHLAKQRFLDWQMELFQ